MQIKLFTIPILGGEKTMEDLNTFLRSKKVLQLEKQLINNGGVAYWCFCIEYLENSGGSSKSKKVDYKEKLDEKSFKRFTEMRHIRRTLAKEEGIPAFAIFTDEEMAGLAKFEELTLAKMKSVKGIGPKKIEKFASHFIPQKDNEKSQ